MLIRSCGEELMHLPIKTGQLFESGQDQFFCEGKMSAGFFVGIVAAARNLLKIWAFVFKLKNVSSVFWCSASK